MTRRYDLAHAAFEAFLAGKALQLSRGSMDSARIAHVRGDSRELICMYVRHAREWHRDYMVHLAKALQP